MTTKTNAGADDGKSVDQILEGIETTQNAAGNIVRNAFTVGQEAYYNTLKIKGIDKDTGKLIYDGDIAEANKAMRDTTFRPFLSHVFAPNATEAQIDAILAVMGDPAHEYYATNQYMMAFGEAGQEWLPFWKSLKEPLDAVSFTQNLEGFIKGGMGSASAAVQMRTVTESDIAKLVKEAEGRIAADPKYQLGPKWNQQTAPQLAMQYLLAHRKMEDPVAATMAEKGYLQPRHKEE